MNPPLPSLFISHGSPMHALEAGAAGEAWRNLAERLERPVALLMVSAHWETSLPCVTGSAEPATIHDFVGFPEALHRIRYGAPGAPELAGAVQTRLAAAGIACAVDLDRGLDHGAWSPLLHMFPDASLPVLQLSVQPDQGAEHHFAVGRALRPLAREGVLVIASGHMTHNLRDYFRPPAALQDRVYAREFRNWVDARLARHELQALLDWEVRAPHARRAHPAPEHFLPLFVALGVAPEDYELERVFTGFDGDTLAMDAYAFY